MCMHLSVVKVVTCEHVRRTMAVVMYMVEVVTIVFYRLAKTDLEIIGHSLRIAESKATLTSKQSEFVFKTNSFCFQNKLILLSK